VVVVGSGRTVLLIVGMPGVGTRSRCAVVVVRVSIQFSCCWVV